MQHGNVTTFSVKRILFIANNKQYFILLINTELSSFIVKIQGFNLKFITEQSIKDGKSCEPIISPISNFTYEVIKYEMTYHTPFKRLTVISWRI